MANLEIDSDIPITQRIRMESPIKITLYIITLLFIVYSFIFPFALAIKITTTCFTDLTDNTSLVNNYFHAFTIANILISSIYLVILTTYILTRSLCNNNALLMILKYIFYLLLFISLFVNLIIWITGWNLEDLNLTECESENHNFLQYGMIPYIITLMTLFLVSKKIENENVYHQLNNDQRNNIV